MYSHYEPRQGGITRDYELVNESFNTISNTETTYQSAISPHVTYVQRSRPLAFGSHGHMTQVYPNFRAAREGDAFGSDLFALADFYTTRQHEKHELEQLNDKFAQYVEKMYYEVVQDNSSRTKEMYDTERNEASKLIDSTNSDVDAANVSVQQAEQEVKRLRVRYHEVTSLRETDRVLFIN
ncbi:unnamed protein product [Rotaria sp. Silwood2]|nr:unnamed protein product [Rotaria sp. Silwood2]CAF4336292.1 unnamed protein product [Rotaria sp. Silwood2]